MKKTTSTTSKKTAKRVFKKPLSEPKKKEKKFSPKSWAEVEAKGPKDDDEVIESSAPDLEVENIIKDSRYPPRRNNPVYIARWNEYVEDITKRENFKPGHLAQLDILCNLYVEHVACMKFIEKEGMSYLTQTRNGDIWKIRPEVSQLNRVRAEIRSYSKTLGLILDKDRETGDPDEKEDSWE